MSQSRTRVRNTTVRNRTPLAQVQPTTRLSSGGGGPKAPPKEDPAKPLGFAERMLRNTAICVALLLTVLAAQSLNTPGANSATNLLSQVVSMDLNESLGSLRFVSNLMPESAQVFWNLGAEKHGAPSGAEVVHTFSAQEPWLGYGAGEAYASAPGEVMSIAVDAVGRSAVRVRHSGGMETIYGNLLRLDVEEGDWVEAGQMIGAARILTYELRGEGRPMDPAPYLK